MEQYIPKASVVAEIERRIAFFSDINNKQVIDSNLDCAVAFAGLRDFLDTLEVKEVDLEKEIKKEYLERRCYGGRDNMFVILNEPQFNKTAKHFFELGLKAQERLAKREAGMQEE